MVAGVVVVSSEVVVVVGDLLGSISIDLVEARSET